ncbi:MULTISPECIES: ATP-binding protein [unclassified Polaribacter]|uniref:ATP-binding protein n=1 Tax=unclassified Polaribacter TaxID=196858 RepID=UPI0011BEB2AA|nr:MULTISPECIES: ATP-binding protein [unclassified Polaribacter]TXD53544.1 ATP-binding protein [Polaribacter sp. IC063]TXD58616.1 ATP-binding protein [Polaribacter sp. IC066]
MRYLNKIVFINSASVSYAEIELDGNVHLIGTQGVGKSTLLRAILFFYNANKIKLGIPREKKSFDDYYFEYQNSYIIYEIVKDTIPYCVLAYKVNGKVAYRFFDSEYKRALFIDNNKAFESWDKIRTALGKEIYYTSIISSYEEFRKIIYGDNKGLKPEFRKYALTESKQYQNIPRTIQNVLLNSNLEAKFIKDTIINSINEEEFTIDIENYSKSHLRDFESEINDIKIWFQKNKKGQILIRNQADKIITEYRIFNFLKRERRELANNLGLRMAFIENEKPLLATNFQHQHQLVSELFKKKENLTKTHRKREQDLVSDIKYILKELAKAKLKQTEYDNKNIKDIIKKVARKENLTNEHKALSDENTLLTSNFTSIAQKYDALISKMEIQKQEFSNTQNATINTLNGTFGENKTLVHENYQQLIHQIKDDNEDEKELYKNELNTVIENENRCKRQSSELKHQTFFIAEIEQFKEEIKLLDASIKESNAIISNANDKIVTTKTAWELEVRKDENTTEIKIDKERENLEKIAQKIKNIETKINQSTSSLYGWLNENISGWEHTIGKVIDEDVVLFNTELNPKLVNKSTSTFFGIELNLNALKTRIKTVEEYHQDIETLKNEKLVIHKIILKINEDKDTHLQKLKSRFRKILKEFKDAIAENNYIIVQSTQKLKAHKVGLTDWITKSKQEKENSYQKIAQELEEIASKKLKAVELLENIKKGIKRKITLKENERNKEITSLALLKDDKILEINAAIFANKKVSIKRIQELKKQQTTVLDNKGADTKRLAIIDKRLNEIKNDLLFINTNQRLVFDYEKDKRELFDKIPEFKVEKISLEKKQIAISKEHLAETRSLDKKYANQKEIVGELQSKLDDFEKDENKFLEFKKSDAFIDVQHYISNPTKDKKNLKTGSIIISEITENHYKGIGNFNDLQQSTNTFIGNFNENNVFNFKVKLNSDADLLIFATDLKEFIDEDKINQYEKRVNHRFASIIRLIGRETTELNSKKGDIEKIIKKINDDFVNKNFVEAIKEMEMRTQASSNPVVKLLIKIQEFNDEHSLVLGESNLFTASDSDSKNQKAVDLLKELVKAIDKYKNTTLTLSESFDLQFRIVENDNDSGWVEKLSNVGSEGTDVLVKAMINILLLNVFKESASKKFKDFKLHCMLDEIGRLHPNNVKGILRFANERNILLINGSPISQNATDYKYTYKLAKEQAKNDPKRYITKINRLVKITSKVL